MFSGSFHHPPNVGNVVANATHHYYKYLTDVFWALSIIHLMLAMRSNNTKMS